MPTCASRISPSGPVHLEPDHLQRRGSGYHAFTQLNTAGTSNDNIYYTGNPGQQYNQGVGLGLPDLTKIADLFGQVLPF